MHTTRDISLILVMPPQAGLIKGFATGLISIANHVASHLPELAVEILDLSETPPDNFPTKIRPLVERMPGVLFVGITTTTASYQSGLRTARAFKEASPSCVVVLGGHHAGVDYETVLKNHVGEVDFVVVGEGEIPTVELLKNHPDVHTIPGLVYLEEGQVFQNPLPPLLDRRTLDTLPMTFRGNGLLSAPGKFGHVTYVSARGCPLHCSFCSVANQPIRTRSVRRVKEDIHELVEMGFTKIAVEDNFFAHSLARTTEICESLKDLRSEIGESFTWDCQTRVESMTRPDIVPLMESAGCDAVYIGVESVNEDTLLYLGKTVHPARYLTQLVDIVIPRLLESKIECYLNLQFGLPHENDEHHKKTFEMLRTIGELARSRRKVITIFPQLFVVYPGTRHFKEGVEQRLFKNDIFESFTEWEVKEEPIRRWLGEYFAHGVGGLPVGILEMDGLSEGKYAISSDKVAKISATIRHVECITGIQVFHYGSYLTSEKQDPHIDYSRKSKTKLPTEVR